MRASFPPSERRTLLGLSGVLAARLLGFSLVLPMFSTYATETLHATRMQAGIAFGIYGLSQAMLQIPFGTWSDRFGRKRMVQIGLLVFIIGSAISATASDIVGLTVGYFLQGASAISSPILAWVTDSIDVSRRNTGMAVIGMSIGASIVFGLPLSPVVARAFGGAAVFWACGALSALALAIVTFGVHDPGTTPETPRPTESPGWGALLRDREMMTLNAAGFLVYFAMRAVYFVTPAAMKAMDVNQGRLFMVVGLLGASLMGMGSRQSDKGRARVSVMASFSLTLAGYLMMGFVAGWTGTVVGYGVWFVGFCVLQALLPGAVSKLAPAEARGATLGLFNTCQYVGTAFGGPAGGGLDAQALYGLLAGLTALVIWAASGIRRVDETRIAQRGAP
ncbi:MAG: MFS transporter [Proteobacteria bacterium]|nr:MFS transporter [Pseudomonadota bacterium]